MSYVIQCDFCGIQGESEPRRYTSPNLWREIRLREGHSGIEEQSIHACPECSVKHLWPKERYASIQELIDVLRFIGERLKQPESIEPKKKK